LISTFCGVDARKGHRHRPFVARFAHVCSRRERQQRRGRLRPIEFAKHATEERVEIAVQAGEFSKWRPTSHTQHRNPSFLQSSGRYVLPAVVANRNGSEEPFHFDLTRRPTPKSAAAAPGNVSRRAVDPARHL
jgi:hypothetical protein